MFIKVMNEYEVARFHSPLCIPAPGYYCWAGMATVLGPADVSLSVGSSEWSDLLQVKTRMLHHSYPFYWPITFLIFKGRSSRRDAKCQSRFRRNVAKCSKTAPLLLHCTFRG